MLARSSALSGTPRGSHTLIVHTLSLINGLSDRASKQAQGAPRHPSQAHLSPAYKKVAAHLARAVDTGIRMNVQLLLDSYTSKHARLQELAPAGVSQLQVSHQSGTAWMSQLQIHL